MRFLSPVFFFLVAIAIVVWNQLHPDTLLVVPLLGSIVPWLRANPPAHGWASAGFFAFFGFILLGVAFLRGRQR